MSKEVWTIPGTMPGLLPRSLYRTGDDEAGLRAAAETLDWAAQRKAPLGTASASVR